MARVDVNLDPNWRNIIGRETEPEWSEAADDLAETARHNAPVQTGELRDSIQGDVVDGAAEARATAEHARFVEDGTRHMDAQPFLRPALITVVAKRYGLG